MTEATESRKLKWKWMGYSLLTYLLFYFLPIVGVGDLIGGRTAMALIGCWVLGGLVLLGGILGYLSKGAAIWEPALAGGLIIFCISSSVYILRAWPHFATWSVLAEVGGLTIGTFLLSLLGAWFGVRLERAFSPRTI